MNDLQRQRLERPDERWKTGKNRWDHWVVFMGDGKGGALNISYGLNSYGDGPEGTIIEAKYGIDPDDARLICQAPEMLRALDEIVGRLEGIDEDDLTKAEKQILKIATKAIDATDRTKDKYKSQF